MAAPAEQITHQMWRVSSLAGVARCNLAGFGPGAEAAAERAVARGWLEWDLSDDGPDFDLLHVPFDVPESRDPN